MKISLGVLQVPEPEGGDTYITALALESKYGLFSKFVEFDINNIASELEDSISGSLETIMQGGKSLDPFAAATSQIDQNFRDFLSSKEAESQGMVGVPTQAALDGKSLRFKGRVTASSYIAGKRAPIVKKTGPRRPSFIYSGVLQASFKSWVEE